MVRAILSLLMVAGLLASGVARADHTKEDAQATTAKLQAILHPPPKRHAKAKPAAQAQSSTAQSSTAQSSTTAAQAAPQKQAREAPTPIVDPLASLIVHAFTIPFDPKEREAHLRDIPKNAKELDAHLRRLDAALRAKHVARE